MKKITQLFLLISVCFWESQIGYASLNKSVGNGKANASKQKAKSAHDSFNGKRSAPEGTVDLIDKNHKKIKSTKYTNPKESFQQFLTYCGECIGAFKDLEWKEDILKRIQDPKLDSSCPREYWFLVKVSSTNSGVKACIGELQGYFNIFKDALADEKSSPDQSPIHQLAGVSCLAYCNFYERMMLGDGLESEQENPNLGFVDFLEKTDFFTKESIANLKTTLNKENDFIKPLLIDLDELDNKIFKKSRCK